MSDYEYDYNCNYEKFDACNCNICSKLEEDYAGRFVDIKTKCPSYYIARGRILEIKNNLVIMALPGSGIIVICCDNISFVRPTPV